MRLWTVHPRYLDPAGLVALWREALLAQKVLAGLTRGYVRHPQLTRFREQSDPQAAVAAYLAAVWAEAHSRGYAFDATKIGERRAVALIVEQDGQLAYEWAHLLGKLDRRNPGLYERWRTLPVPQAHPLFRIVPGGVREWEKRADKA